MVCSAAWLTLGGCESLAVPVIQTAAFHAATSAGYAGRFRLAYSRWPSAGELEEFMCMPGQAGKFGLDPISCDDVAALPYRLELTPRGDDLQMKFFDSSNQLHCSLVVRAPPTGADTATFPMIRIRTSVFSCKANR